MRVHPKGADLTDTGYSVSNSKNLHIRFEKVRCGGVLILLTKYAQVGALRESSLAHFRTGKNMHPGSMLHHATAGTCGRTVEFMLGNHTQV